MLSVVLAIRTWGHEFDSTDIAACVCNANTGKAETGGSLRFACQSNWISKLQVYCETLPQKNQVWMMKGGWPLDFAGAHCMLTLLCACMHMNMYIHRRNTLSVMKTSGKRASGGTFQNRCFICKRHSSLSEEGPRSRQKLWGRSRGIQMSFGEDQHSMLAQQKGPEDKWKGCWEVSSRSHQY